MAQTIKLKRSSVPGNVPLSSQLELGEVAINTFDGKMFIKKDNGTPAVIEVSGGGGVDSLLDLNDVGPDGLSGQVLTTDGAGNFTFTQKSAAGEVENTYSRAVVTASANQTVFPASYTVGFVDVYKNGLKLVIGIDYNASNGSSVTLATGAAGGDAIEIIAYNGVTFKQVAQLSLAKFSYTATSGQTVFSGSDDASATLAYIPNYIDVYLNGILLDGSDYTATDGTSIVLAAGATTGDSLKVTSFITTSIDNLAIGGNLELGGSNVTATGAELSLLDALPRGSILYGNSSGASAVLPIGAEDAVLSSDGTDIVWAAPVSTRFVEKTVDYTTVAGDKIIVDSSVATITITLPLNPTLGDEIAIIDGANNAANNNITIASNNQRIDGTEGNMLIDVSGAAFNVVYYNIARGWIFSER
jgi:hypothetical protein